MRALTWQGTRERQGGDVPDPDDRGADRRDRPDHLDRDLRLRPAPLRGARACTSTRGRPRSRGDGRRRGGRRRGDAARGGRPGRHPVQHLLRHLLDVRPRAARAVRDHAGARPGQGRGALRLHEAVRAGAGRAGRVPARAAGAVRPDRVPDDGGPTSGTSSSPTSCPRRGRRSRTRTCRRAAPSRCVGLGPIGQMAARIAAHQGRRDRHRRRPACRSGSRWRASTASRSSTSRRPTTSPAAIQELTGGRGADASIDAVGMEAHGSPVAARRRRRPPACLPDALAAPLTEKVGIDRLTALQHGHRVGAPRRDGLDLRRVRRRGRPDADDGAVRQGPDAADGSGERAPLDRRAPAAAHRRRRPAWRPGPAHPPVPLEQAPEAYATFQQKEDGCIKVVLDPSLA